MSLLLFFFTERCWIYVICTKKNLSEKYVHTVGERNGGDDDGREKSNL